MSPGHKKQQFVKTAIYTDHQNLNSTAKINIRFVTAPYSFLFTKSSSYEACSEVIKKKINQ